LPIDAKSDIYFFNKHLVAVRAVVSAGFKSTVGVPATTHKRRAAHARRNGNFARRGKMIFAS
jgi:hypothetical protein